MAVPLLFAQIGVAAVEFTDTAFLGRVGSTELAAIGLAESVLDFAIAPCIGLIEAMQIVIARRAGQRRKDEVAPTFNRTLRLVLIASIALALLLRVGSDVLAKQVIAPAAVASAFTQFFRYGAIGLVFLALSLAYSSLYIGLGRTRILLAATLVLVGVNVVLSYALILGHLGAPQLGIEGAGIAFAIAEAGALLFLSVRAARQHRVGGRGLLRARIAGGTSTAQLAGLGWPISGQVLIEAVRWVGFLLIVDRIGRDELAASSIVYVCYGVLLIPTDAFAESVYSLVSNLIGRDQAHGIRVLVRRGILIAYAITIPFIGLIVLAPGTVLAIFTSHPGTISAATESLRLVGLLMLIVIPGDLWLAAVFGTGETRAGSAIELLASALMLIGAYLAGLALDLPLTFVWATLGLSAALSLLASYRVVRTGHWRAHEL